MKKLFLILSVTAIALCAGTQASAQEQVQQRKQRKMAVAGYYAIGSGPTFGVGAKFQYLVTNNFRLEASPAILFRGDPGVLTNVLDLSVHAHYRFSVGSHQMKDRGVYFYLYPLAGLGVYRVAASGEIMGYTVKESETALGADVGAGFEICNLTKRASIFTEMKMGIGKDLSRFTWSMGWAYHF